MQTRISKSLSLCVAFCLGMAPAVYAQLDDHCTVSVLNRTAQVAADGSWVVNNIPATFGPVRARATCLNNGVTQTFQSNLFVMRQGIATGIGADSITSTVTPIPVRLTLTATATKLTQPQQIGTLTVSGTFADGTAKDLTRATAGTTYVVSNPALATVSADGVVTAKATGTVFVQALNEGAQGLLQLTISLSGDTDGDGIPDDVELSLGLDPNNPADASDDPDHDGLSNLEEFRAGTDIHNPDSDGDGLTDGQEVHTWHSNPLLKDTDGDGVPDNIEVATGSDPANPASFNLQAALSGIRATPPTFSIDSNAASGSGFQQLNVTGDFKLGGTIDLTLKARGTSYSSSSLQVCAFSAQDGQVVGVSSGTCVVTIANSGFSATVTGAVNAFSPTPISKLDLPGGINSVDIQGNFAYVAAGANGLIVADVSDLANPRSVGTVDTPGNANNVRVVGNLAYVADGSSGLQIVDVTNPVAPTIVGSVFSNDAQDITVFDGRAYMADARVGLVILDVTNPANPTVLKTVPAFVDASLQGSAHGVDILQASNNKLYALLAEGTTGTTASFSGIAVIDISDVNTAAVVAHLALPIPCRDLRISGQRAYVVSGGGLHVVDLTNPLAPVLTGAFATQFNHFQPKDVQIGGNAAIFADEFKPSDAPIVDVSDPTHPVAKSEVDFISLFPAGSRGWSGTGIALRGPYVFLAAAFFGFNEDFKQTTGALPGSQGLLIGQYTSKQDTAGIAPQVALAAPPASSSVLGNSVITLRANATDDVVVDSVTFNVNGVDVFTDNSAPYEALYPVPANATGLTITATARDFGNNSATSAPVNVTVIPDPLTTVSGKIVRAVNGVGTPVLGATVTCIGLSGLTAADGSFNIPGAPTVRGQISCTGAFDDGAGKVFTGKSFRPLPPVPGGITNIPVFSIK